MHIEVRHLRLVVAIVDSGSIAGAAKRLHLTPSALSHQLRDIESRLRTPLFRREDRRMIPTDAGNSLLAVAQRVLADLDHVESALRSGDAANAAGSIRISTQCYTCYHWLPRIIADFAREWPDVKIGIVPEATRAPHEAVSEGRVDVAVVHGRIESNSLQYTPLFEDDIMLVVSPSHPLAQAERVHPRDLAREHLILYDIPSDQSIVQRDILAGEGVVPARLSKIPLTEAIVELVKAGLGVSILARWAVAPQLASKEVAAVPIDSPGAHRKWSAVRRAGGVHPRFESAFIALLTGAFAEYQSRDVPQQLRLA